MKSVENRRAPRREPREPIDVNEHVSGDVIGLVGNLSSTGMMLIGHQRVREGALYQLRFSLCGADGKPHLLNAGAQVMWSSAAATHGQYWAGFCFIALNDDDVRALQDWLARPEMAV
jgi:PilZ domain